MMTKKRAYYQKRDGTYFLASADDYTRSRYEMLGHRYTTKTDVPSIVMTPTLPKEDQEMLEYLKYFPLVVVEDKPSAVEQSTMPSIVAKVIQLVEDDGYWIGTATELVQKIGEGKVNKLFQYGVLDYLNRSGVQVIRKRSNKKRLIELSKVDD